MSDLNFRIEASSKAFEILASNLYSDKIAAVIRELSCNAADAHIEAGIPAIPFEVTLPHGVQHYFKIRDFGNGLRADQIEDVFAVFFSSTKTGSKAYTGAFGLGCKSPFAISDNFYVNSYIDGRSFSYLCHKKDGMPSISFLKDEPTPQKNGLEIIVPVKSTNTFHEWHIKAQKIYEYFKVRPKTNIKLTYFSESEDYICDNRWENTEEKGTYVVMNNVRYYLDMNKLQKTLNPKNSYNSHGIAYHVAPRSIEVTPSREGISYTKETVDFLTDHIESINQEFIKKVQSHVETQESMLVAQMEFVKIRRKYSSEYYDDDAFLSAKNYFWNGVQLSSVNTITPKIFYTENVEIGWLYKPSKYSANLKKPIFTNTELPFSLESNLGQISFIINDTKASQETIKIWANRKFKNSGFQTMSFLVIQKEYENILTVHNKISKKLIFKCSDHNLVKLTKVAGNRTKTASKNIEMHTLSMNCNVLESSHNSENDIIPNIVDENNVVYYVSCISMNPLYANSILVDNTNGNHYLKDITDVISAFDRVADFAGCHIANKFSSKKFLLLKATKKNNAFMKRYAKENKVRFVPLWEKFKHFAKDYLSHNDKFSSYTANRFIMYSIFDPTFYDEDDKFLMHLNIEKDFFNKMAIFVDSFDVWKQHMDKSETLKQLCEFLAKHICGASEENYFWSFVMKNNFKENSEFFDFIIQNCQQAKEILVLMKDFFAKNNLFFLSPKEKDEKIIEYCVTGKIA